MDKETIYNEATMKNMGEYPMGTRMQIVYSAMDEYAKQQAMGFSEWTSENNYSYRGAVWIHLGRDVEGLPIRATTQELYSLYLTQKK